MAVVTAGVDEERVLDVPLVVRERLEAFGVEVLGGAMNRSVQVRNGGLYLRGLLEQGARKSLGCGYFRTSWNSLVIRGFWRRGGRFWVCSSRGYAGVGAITRV